MTAARSIAARLFLAAAAAFVATPGATIQVPAGGDLQAAIDRASPGDTIVLEPGAVYTGPFTLPEKPGSAFITITTRGPAIVAEGQRIGADAAAHLAVLRAPSGESAIRTSPGAHHWRLQLLAILGGPSPGRDLVSLGDGSPAQASLAAVPHDLVVDRCIIRGDSASGQRRCIALNSARTRIANSYVADCKSADAEAQAIAGWNGPGPFTIVDNYLEGAGENVMFGGADPAIPDLVPSDIAIVGNTIVKPEAWRRERWQVKNLVELKNARRVTIAGNLIAYNWVAAQNGYGILFTVRNQNGACRWCEVTSVVFERNLVAHVGGAISILGTDNAHPSGAAQGISVRSNVFADVDDKRWGRGGYVFLLNGGPSDVAIDHNTIVQTSGAGILQVDGPPAPGFVFTANIARHLEYGFIGTGHAPDADTIAAFLPGSRISGNIIAGAAAGRLPAGNLTPPADELCKEVVSCDGGDYRLRPDSAWRAADRREPGAGWVQPTTHPPAVQPPRAIDDGAGAARRLQ
jgi:hypothetical protein